jgi:prevent-host-death family protein
MPIATLSSREFNQDTGRAKKAAKRGPVLITDRGRPAHVLLTIEDYRKADRRVPHHLRHAGYAGWRRHRLRTAAAERCFGAPCRPALMFVLDTNVVSELRKAGKADHRVVAWANAVPAPVLVSHHGSGAGTRRTALRRWLNDQVLPAFANRVLSIDVEVAQRCAQLHVPDRMADRDALIATTALVHGMTVVTRNTADFARSGVPLINPWQH